MKKIIYGEYEIANNKVVEITKNGKILKALIFMEKDGKLIVKEKENDKTVKEVVINDEEEFYFLTEKFKRENFDKIVDEEEERLEKHGFRIILEDGGERVIYKPCKLHSGVREFEEVLKECENCKYVDYLLEIPISLTTIPGFREKYIEILNIFSLEELKAKAKQ